MLGAPMFPVNTESHLSNHPCHGLDGHKRSSGVLPKQRTQKTTTRKKYFGHNQHMLTNISEHFLGLLERENVGIGKRWNPSPGPK
eukprot:3637315-Amphidinium_carterae.1